jgi:hypothetical protein
VGARATSRSECRAQVRAGDRSGRELLRMGSAARVKLPNRERRVPVASARRGPGVAPSFAPRRAPDFACCNLPGALGSDRECSFATPGRLMGIRPRNPPVSGGVAPVFPAILPMVAELATVDSEAAVNGEDLFAQNRKSKQQGGNARASIVVNRDWG